MITGQATISIMSMPFAPERLTCTVLPGTERRVIIKRINPNTKKNPKTDPNHNPNPPKQHYFNFQRNSVKSGVSIYGYAMGISDRYRVALCCT